MTAPDPGVPSRGASSNGLSRALSRRRRLSENRPWTPEPIDDGNGDGAGGSEAPNARRTRIFLWLSILVLQLSVASTCVATVYLVQDLRALGLQPFHIIWFVLSLSLCLTGASTTYLLLRRRREIRQAATQSTIIRLNADVDVLVQQNIELQVTTRRSRDHGSISSRRASPLGEEDFASYHRFQERGMDVGVKVWLDQVELFKGRFMEMRGDSWFESSVGSERTAPDGNVKPHVRAVRTA